VTSGWLFAFAIFSEAFAIFSEALAIIFVLFKVSRPPCCLLADAFTPYLRDTITYVNLWYFIFVGTGIIITISRNTFSRISLRNQRLAILDF